MNDFRLAEELVTAQIEGKKKKSKENIDEVSTFKKFESFILTNLLSD